MDDSCSDRLLWESGYTVGREEWCEWLSTTWLLAVQWCPYEVLLMEVRRDDLIEKRVIRGTMSWLSHKDEIHTPSLNLIWQPFQKDGLLYYDTSPLLCHTTCSPRSESGNIAYRVERDHVLVWIIKALVSQIQMTTFPFGWFFDLL